MLEAIRFSASVKLYELSDKLDNEESAPLVSNDRAYDRNDYDRVWPFYTLYYFYVTMWLYEFDWRNELISSFHKSACDYNYV